jgi:Flp pilus assembly pilin Flp
VFFYGGLFYLCLEFVRFHYLSGECVGAFFARVARSARSFVFGRRAATAIEYALMAASIALAIMAMVFLMGTDVLALYQSVQDSLSAQI